MMNWIVETHEFRVVLECMMLLLEFLKFKAHCCDMIAWSKWYIVIKLETVVFGKKEMLEIWQHILGFKDVPI